MKLCKDCKWCEMDGQGDPEFARCLSPNNRKFVINPVTGGKEGGDVTIYTHCYLQREDDTDVNACQLKARWFEPKELSASEGGEADTKK